MLRDDMVRHGQWLFRWRSYLPVILVPVAIGVFESAGWMSRIWGEPVEDGFDYFCLLVALAGLVLRIAVAGFVPVGTSGRNTARQEAESLNVTGLYSLVRHPLYFANFLVFIAFVLLFKSLLFTLFAAVSYFLYYERIMLAEEQFLEGRYGERYRGWAAMTPAFLPRLSGWVRPVLPFSWRTALRRECHTVFLVGAVFFLIEMLEAALIDHQGFAEWWIEEPFWTLLLLLAGAIYAATMIVKKTTGWLRVAGR